MIRSRLVKLERLALEAAANCPGCRRIPHFVVSPLITSLADTAGDDDAEPAPTARCGECGKVHEQTVIRIMTPGLKAPIVALD